MSILGILTAACGLQLRVPRQQPGPPPNGGTSGKTTTIPLELTIRLLEEFEARKDREVPLRNSPKRKRRKKKADDRSSS